VPERRRLLRREDILVVLCSLVIGFAGASAYAVYRAVHLSNESVAGRLSEFAQNLLFPGAIIFAAVAVAVFGGWKANID
jgi:hypothetical protein